MAYNINWHVEGRIILMRLHGDMSVDDIIQISERMTEMIRAASQQVYIITDAQEVGKMPVNIGQLSRHVSFMREPMLGAIVTVGIHNVFTRFIASMLAQLSQIELKMADTLDEAITFIQRIDPALDVSKTQP